MSIIDIILAIGLLIAFPIGVYLFSRKIVTWEGIKDMANKYQYHFYLLVVVYLLKMFIFLLEGPAENLISLDFTPAIYELEGNAVFWVQYNLQSTAMTWFMAFIYICSFLFIMTFSLGLFAYNNMYKVASKLALVNLILFLLAIPFILFLVVYVPSYPKMFYPEAHSLIRGIEPLLYNLGPNINEFFMGYESFNNCFPSLHIGMPTAILLTMVRNVKGFRGYKIFLMVMIFLIALSIIYLGVHWFLDIIGGILIGILGFYITEKVNMRFWNRVHNFRKKYHKSLDTIFKLPDRK